MKEDRYLYCISQGANYEYYVEEYKIVYELDDEIYYHKPGDRELSNRTRCWIHDELEEDQTVIVGYYFKKPDKSILEERNLHARERRLTEEFSRLCRERKELKEKLSSVDAMIDYTLGELDKIKQ